MVAATARGDAPSRVDRAGAGVAGEGTDSGFAVLWRTHGVACCFSLAVSFITVQM